MPELSNTYYNDETDEIIGKIPPWIIRRGNAIIFLIFIGLIIMSCFITYQDSIVAPTIVHYSNGHFMATAMIPEKGFGKLEIGQKVIIKLESYPETEFGHLTGTVSEIDASLQNGAYSIGINIHSTITNYGKQIKPITGMSATSKVIVVSHPLIMKFRSPLKQIIVK